MYLKFMLTQKTRSGIRGTRHVEGQQSPPLEVRMEDMPREQLAYTLLELRPTFPTVHTGVVFLAPHRLNPLDDSGGERGACLVVLLRVVVDHGLQLVEQEHLLLCRSRRGYRRGCNRSRRGGHRVGMRRRQPTG